MLSPSDDNLSTILLLRVYIGGLHCVLFVPFDPFELRKYKSNVSGYVIIIR